MKPKERIRWIDVAKFFGIFAIYLGHLYTSAGKSYNFVFLFHVPLFFFLSGCMDYYDTEKNILKYIYKKFKTIMIPFFVFSILAIIVYGIGYNSSLNEIIEQLKFVIKGNIRDSFVPAGSLWFLSCLFVMQVIFKLIKQFKYKIIIIGSCILLFIIYNKFIVNNPNLVSNMYYNFDAALYYIIYFGLGYLTFPYIVSFFKLDKKWKKVVFYISLVLTLVYSILLYDQSSLIPNSHYVMTVINASVIIWLVLTISKICENVSYFNKIGKETLYLCCNEDIMKTLIPVVLGLFSLNISFGTPLHAYIYAFLLLVINIELVIPFEKRFVKTILNKK